MTESTGRRMFRLIEPIAVVTYQAREPLEQLAGVVDGMRARGLVDASGWLTDAGRATKEAAESLTDDLAAPAYDGLDPSELERLIADLEPLAATLAAVGSA